MLILWSDSFRLYNELFRVLFLRTEPWKRHVATKTLGLKFLSRFFVSKVKYALIDLWLSTVSELIISESFQFKRYWAHPCLWCSDCFWDIFLGCLSCACIELLSQVFTVGFTKLFEVQVVLMLEKTACSSDVQATACHDVVFISLWCNYLWDVWLLILVL